MKIQIQKNRITGVILFLSLLLTALSCKKETNSPGNQDAERKVKFILYTDKDLSDDSDSIFFKLSIQDASNHVLWDSLLAPMTVKDIPDQPHKIIIEKSVPGNDPSILKVGFYYSIKDIGISWWLEQFNAGDTLKTVDFNFQ